MKYILFITFTLIVNHVAANQCDNFFQKSKTTVSLISTAKAYVVGKVNNLKTEEEFVLYYTKKYANRRTAHGISHASMPAIQAILRSRGIIVTLERMQQIYDKYGFTDWDFVKAWSLSKHDIKLSRKEKRKFKQNFPNLKIEDFAPAQFFHGSSSSSLLMFSQYGRKLGGLVSLQELENNAKVVFSGEMGRGAVEGGISNSHVSTTSIKYLEETMGYTVAFQSYDANAKKINPIQERMLRSVEDMDTRAMMVDGYKKLKDKRIQAWGELTKAEKDLVSHGFPVLYGIKPSHDTRVLKLFEYDPEINFVRIDFNEIVTIYVPKDKISLVEELIRNLPDAEHIKVRNIDPLLADYFDHAGNKPGRIISEKDILHLNIEKSDSDRWKDIQEFNRLTYNNNFKTLDFLNYFYQKIGIPLKTEEALRIKKSIYYFSFQEKELGQEWFVNYLMMTTLKFIYATHSSDADWSNKREKIWSMVEYLGLGKNDVKIYKLVLNSKYLEKVLTGSMKPKDAYWEITFAAEEVQIHENILYRIMLNVYYFHLSGLDAGISGIFERDISFKMQILDDKLYKLDKEF